VLSVVDMHSFRVDGYFEETKLSGIDIGQPVDIKIMGEPTCAARPCRQYRRPRSKTVTARKGRICCRT
jgi:hypothetical protein